MRVGGRGVKDFEGSMSFRSKLGFGVSSFDISAFEPDELVGGELLGWSRRSFALHDFAGQF